MSTFLADIRFTIRLLVRSPVLTLVAALSLGLGIGANTLIFSLVNEVFLRPGQHERLRPGHVCRHPSRARGCGLPGDLSPGAPCLPRRPGDCTAVDLTVGSRQSTVDSRQQSSSRQSSVDGAVDRRQQDCGRLWTVDRRLSTD
jgi:hypothetical protein